MVLDDDRCADDPDGQAEVELGAALRLVNQRTAAREPLRRARALTGTESLTPAERQAAVLAAVGLDNVAERPVPAPRTP